MPPSLKPERTATPDKKTGREVESSWVALIENWRLVRADLSLHHGIDLWDPAVQARPWPGVRNAIFSLLDHPTRLQAALTRTESP